ncbi:DUF4232 domain-containing protein [Streptomyces yaizuensis]|uniref:DUF4232 domain-containing protein n=1 Tax=Streptomyces yaizuensis TaxID=2989713 RepID=A0ABQ5NZW2_9ACTN|nr:DUF4232 domain-containing protein [Streptomyces sp. YSPA8]GLF95893.1 DUF4232 domain-containing protein [Streptomyces sp. YSPA8]
MSDNRRKAFLASAVLVCNLVLMTACQGQETDGITGSGAAQGSSAATPAATPAGSSAGSSAADSGQGTTKGTAKGADATGEAAGEEAMGAAGSGFDTGNGKRVPVEQSCGANDISWSTRSESQAGGYILVVAKAKSGISCYLPAALPTVAFGSDGTQAGPAEQSAGRQIKLGGGTTAYAGVNPKTTGGNGGKQLDSIIVGVGNDDPNPVSLPVGPIVVDRPVVTNWHTDAADAVPLG